MDGKIEVVNFLEDFPSDVKEAVREYLFEEKNSPEHHKIQKRLLTDKRMTAFWKLVCDEEYKSKRKDILCDFFYSIPKALVAGMKMQAVNVDKKTKDDIAVLSDYLETTKKLRRQLTGMRKNFKLRESLHSSTEACLAKLEKWIQEKQGGIEYAKTNTPWMVLDLVPLKDLNMGSKNSDETFTTLILAHLFKQYFSDPKIPMVADLVMVMKGVPRNEGRDLYIDRAKKSVKKHLHKLKPSA